MKRIGLGYLFALLSLVIFGCETTTEPDSGDAQAAGSDSTPTGGNTPTTGGDMTPAIISKDATKLMF